MLDLPVRRGEAQTRELDAAKLGKRDDERERLVVGVGRVGDAVAGKREGEERFARWPETFQSIWSTASGECRRSVDLKAGLHSHASSVNAAPDQQSTRRG